MRLPLMTMDETWLEAIQSLDDFLPETIEWYREHLDQYAFSRAQNKGYSILKILHIIAGAKRAEQNLVPSTQKGTEQKGHSNKNLICRPHANFLKLQKIGT